MCERGRSGKCSVLFKVGCMQLFIILLGFGVCIGAGSSFVLGSCPDPVFSAAFADEIWLVGVGLKGIYIASVLFFPLLFSSRVVAKVESRGRSFNTSHIAALKFSGILFIVISAGRVLVLMYLGFLPHRDISLTIGLAGVSQVLFYQRINRLRSKYAAVSKK